MIIQRPVQVVSYSLMVLWGIRLFVQQVVNILKERLKKKGMVI